MPTNTGCTNTYEEIIRLIELSKQYLMRGELDMACKLAESTKVLYNDENNLRSN